MYVNRYDRIPLWAWGLDLESLNEMQSLERIEIKYFCNEIDLLNDFDFLMDDFL